MLARLRAAFLALERASTALATTGACAMLVVASALGMWQIVTRFVIERPAEWTEVLIRFSLIWMVFLGIPLAFRIGAMVSVDVLYRWSGQRLRRVLDTLVSLAALGLVMVIIVVGWDYLAMPVGGVFCVVAIVGHWLDPQRMELETAQ